MSMVRNFMSTDSQSAIDSILDIIANGDEYAKRIQEIKDEQEKLAAILAANGGIKKVKEAQSKLDKSIAEVAKEAASSAAVRAEADEMLVQARGTAATIMGDAMARVRDQQDALDMKDRDLKAFAEQLSKRELALMSGEAAHGTKTKNVDAEMNRLQQLRESNEALRQEYLAKKAKVDNILSKL